ncbi:MAG: chemotaxis protein CheX [Verrucomicrobiota bacterium]
MKEESLQIFVRGATDYFHMVTGVAAAVQTPYLQRDHTDLLDYSAVIGISGHHKGCVYFTAQEPLLAQVMGAVGETAVNDGLLFDMVGEIANTISGNARRELGGTFMISAPVLLEERPRRLSLPADLPSFIIPITWQDHRSNLVISLAAE